MGEVFFTNNVEETQAIALPLAKQLKGGETLALYGELGAGKTTFVQGLAKGLGIKKIISPTFIIIRTYKLSFKRRPLPKLKSFYHIDLYRTESKKDIQGLGLQEIMNNKNNIVAIEWAQNLGNLLPKKRIDIYFEYLSDNKRKISITQSNDLNH